ncbi:MULTISPECIES: polyphosphate polymerase domain-containing protein [Actinomycetaceae]|uniref:polyphosphate polymerase domain-containing protein n=1 Tax=Actinomycetaceae TaxID=2049 RepID=UPI00039658B5|nr:MULTISPECIES: polyphosphate polymerase domain-containing protein [Actinomycetaceae]ERH32154.1 VTC domain protein [Actinomyces sp. oral taxon 172 str. F0311]WLD77985.1 polyphosphate polymerase domain-containing protein [Schaalia sp. HMT-172]
MNATLNATLADLETIGLDELNERAAMLTRVDRKYALDAATASSVLSRLPEETRVLQIAGQVSQGYASTYYDTPDMDSYLLTALKRRRRFKVRARTYLSTGASFLEVKTRGPRGVTVKKRMSISWDEAGAPLAGERRSWVAGKVEHTGYAHLVPALEPVLAGSYERNTLLLPDGAGRATVDTDLTWRSLRTDGTEVARPDLVIIETKSGATPSVVDHLLWEGGVRPVKISKYGTAMAAMHDLPANKWHRTLLRYFPEYVEAPELAREAPLAMAA